MKTCVFAFNFLYYPEHRFLTCIPNQQILDELPNADIVVGKLDLSSLESIKLFAENIIKTEEKLNILINNAGQSCVY